MAPHTTTAGKRSGSRSSRQVAADDVSSSSGGEDLSESGDEPLPGAPLQRAARAGGGGMLG